MVKLEIIIIYLANANFSNQAVDICLGYLGISPLLLFF